MKKYFYLYSIPFFSFFLLLSSFDPYFFTCDDGIIGYFEDFVENRWVDVAIYRSIIMLCSIIFLSIFSCLYFKSFWLGIKTIGIVTIIHPFFSFLIIIHDIICWNPYREIDTVYPFLFVGSFWIIEMLIGYIVSRCTVDIMRIFSHSKSINSSIVMNFKEKTLSTSRKNPISHYYDP